MRRLSFFVLFLMLIFFIFFEFKYLRAFRQLGPMITIFAKVAEDVAKFLLIYIFVFLPFCFSFWIMFGGASIESFATMDQLMFTVFRMFVVDDYPFDEMHAHDYVMSYIFVGVNFLVCAIIFMNLMSKNCALP